MDLSTILALATSGSTAITGAANAVSTVRDALKSDKGISDEVKQRISLVLDEVIAAKQMNIHLILEIDRISKEAKADEKFENEIRRYRMTETADGAIVYALKPDQSNNEPMHYLCTACVDERRKSVLQGHRGYRKCPKCGTGYSFESFDIVPDQDRDGW